jgi:hypothetical protein
VQHGQDRRFVAALVKGAPEPLEGGQARELAGVVEFGERNDAYPVVETEGRLAQPSGRTEASSSYTPRPSSRHFST